MTNFTPGHKKNNGEIFSSNSEADSELLENISSVSYGGC